MTEKHAVERSSNAIRKQPAETKKSAGRPIVDRRVRNTVGLMRYLLGTGTGVNQIIIDEIETLAGRKIIAPATRAPASIAYARKLSGQRISEYVSGRRRTPDWVERVAHSWITRRLVESMRDRDVAILLDGSGLDLQAEASQQVLAEGIVGFILAGVAAGDEGRIEMGLSVITGLINPHQVD